LSAGIGERRSRAPSPVFVRLRLDGASGMRLRDVDPGALQCALAGLASTRKSDDWIELKSDSRARVTAGPSSVGPLVIKEYRARGITHRLADCFRGSPARRAWCGGHGLAARGIAVATPIAFLEHRRLGLPSVSTAVFRDARPGEFADACPSDFAPADEVADALLTLLQKLHGKRVIHGDLKASHVMLRRDGEQLSTQLIDLEGVRFPRKLSDADRIRSLAELNASLPDEFPDTLRRRTFDRYATALPFVRGSQAAMQDIVALSLARRHRWTGQSCAPATNG
jgi:hypothetical protein